MKLLASASTMLLLGAWPFISFLSTNRDELLIYGSVVAVYATIYVGVLSVLGIIGRIIFGDTRFPAVAHVSGAGSGACPSAWSQKR